MVGLSLGASGDKAPCTIPTCICGRVLTANCVHVVLRFRLFVLFIHQQPHGEMVCMAVALLFDVLLMVSRLIYYTPKGPFLCSVLGHGSRNTIIQSWGIPRESKG